MKNNETKFIVQEVFKNDDIGKRKVTIEKLFINIIKKMEKYNLK